MVSYGTFQQLSERLVNEDGDVRALTEETILNAAGRGSSSGGASVVYSRGRAKSNHRRGGPKPSRRILLIDEVDVFFSRDFYGETYNPGLSLKLDDIAKLQKLAWSMKGGDTKLILPKLHATDAYISLMTTYAGVKKLLDGQILRMIRDLDAWKSSGPEEQFRSYKIIDGKVAYKSGVCYDANISFDYVTLWTYFHEKDVGGVTDAALEEHLGLFIKCGQFSYAEIPKRYEIILGVTGTLVPETRGSPHPLGTFEQAIIRDDYRIRYQTDLPSVFGEKNLTFRENEHVSVQTDEDNFNNAIGMEAEKALHGRAVLIFFESEAKLQAWHDSAYGQRVPPGIMDCIKSDTRDITVRVRKATHSGTVTLLSREHGRGLDFHCSDKTVEQTGGLHVVQTFLSEELSEEIQIRGRTARQKNKGSFQMILLAQDLDKFEITEAEIKQKEQGIFVPAAAPPPPPATTTTAGGASTAPVAAAPPPAPPAPPATGTAAVPATASTQTMYAFLHEKRAAFLEKSAENRREAVRCALVLHNETTRFQKKLVKLELVSTMQTPISVAMRDQCLQFLSGRNVVKAKCRLLCLSDATGSMSHVWTQTQNSIRAMLERVAEISGGGNIEVTCNIGH
jgi:hypothetical protein